MDRRTHPHHDPAQGPLTSLCLRSRPELLAHIQNVGEVADPSPVFEDLLLRAKAEDTRRHKSQTRHRTTKRQLLTLCVDTIVTYLQRIQGLVDRASAGDCAAARRLFFCFWDDHDAAVRKKHDDLEYESAEALKRTFESFCQAIWKDPQPYERRGAEEIRKLIRTISKRRVLDARVSRGTITNLAHERAASLPQGRPEATPPYSPCQLTETWQPKYRRIVEVPVDDLLSENAEVVVSGRDVVVLKEWIDTHSKDPLDRSNEPCDLLDLCDLAQEFLAAKLSSIRPDEFGLRYAKVLVSVLQDLPAKYLLVLRTRASWMGSSRQDRLERLGLGITQQALANLEKRALDTLVRSLLKGLDEAERRREDTDSEEPYGQQSWTDREVPYRAGRIRKRQADRGR